MIAAKKRERLITAVLMAGVFTLMLMLNIHTPLMMDDYDYSFSWSTGERLAGIGDIIASQGAHYRLWGGRSVTHFLAQLFLYLGKWVFNVCNAVMYCLLLLEIVFLAGKKGSCADWRKLLLAHILLFFTVPFFGVAFLWLDGACNYLWGTALALLPLAISKSEREGGFFDAGFARGWMAMPVCFLAGWSNENTACGVLAAMALLIAWDRFRGRRIRGWRIAAVCAQALGVAVLLLAPGNFARAAEESGRGFVMELVYRFAVTSYCLVRYCGVVLLLGALALLLARKKGILLPVEWLCVLGVSAFLSTYALVGSPQISDRSFTAVICLCIAALLLAAERMLPRMRRGCAVCMLALCAAGGVFAAKAVCAHESAWQAQLAKIETAKLNGEAEALLASVPSVSRYTMGILLEESPDSWPNSTLSKYYGLRISGK